MFSVKIMTKAVYLHLWKIIKYEPPTQGIPYMKIVMMASIFSSNRALQKRGMNPARQVQSKSDENYPTQMFEYI